MTMHVSLAECGDEWSKLLRKIGSNPPNSWPNWLAITARLVESGTASLLEPKMFQLDLVKMSIVKISFWIVGFIVKRYKHAI